MVPSDPVIRGNNFLWLHLCYRLTIFSNSHSECSEDEEATCKSRSTKKMGIQRCRGRMMLSVRDRSRSWWFQIRMELGEEIERGHFDYGCSPKFKKERLLLNASQNLRSTLQLILYDVVPSFNLKVYASIGFSYERAQGREMYHYKRRKGRAHQDSMQEDEKDGLKPEEISGINSDFSEPGCLLKWDVHRWHKRSWWCYNQENHLSLGLFYDEPMILTNAI
ncbi:hypothetical protein IGI04_008405 [Brassica rapa subsp. trilocularis]|uniref:Uncharacterized protein n=1 Tax=Brassica rapa subsp. trilocularis TaxID=1813537 RepID=A0ABQ7NPM1_BRACM|nr:hypothetical protein IGI04_008405 [Brassica rapa subsp. trilocularis]